MNHFRTSIVAGIALLGLTPVVSASGWTGGAELGYFATSGNSDEQTLNAKLDMDYASGKWRHNAYVDIYFAESNNVDTADRLAVGYKPSYFFSEKNYAFGLLRYDTDEFVDIDRRLTEVVGIGRQFINNDRTYFEAEIGAGARQTDYIINAAGLDEDETVIYVGGRFNTRISDSARFLQTLRFEIGGENTFSESITGLQLRVTDAVSAKLTYSVRRNSDVVGIRGDKTDTITGVNLVYSF